MKSRGPGYHLAHIAKHPAGSPGKIREELEEFEDALAQDCKLMAIQELSDIIGAIQLWLEAEEIGLSLDDLIIMGNITQRVFENGVR